MSREDEIAQGLRHPSGALTFPLNVDDYNQGFVDFKAGTEPPKFTSASYDLGRARARQEAEINATFLDRLRAEDEWRDKVMHELLKDHPAVLADYEAKIAEIRGKRKP